ncbi:MAG: hypothetical protein UZ07_CHB004002334 [Chlorobi bacterium OLB7]|nr:MAG: hypothetical protein UZ07_CHB004002334 [Chlorobi bacterium OLB7]
MKHPSPLSAHTGSPKRGGMGGRGISKPANQFLPGRQNAALRKLFPTNDSLSLS